MKSKLLFRSDVGGYAVYSCACMCDVYVKVTEDMEASVFDGRFYVSHHAPLSASSDRKGKAYDPSSEPPDGAVSFTPSQGTPGPLRRVVAPGRGPIRDVYKPSDYADTEDTPVMGKMFDMSDTDLDEEYGKYVYEVELRDTDGIEWDVELNALTGQVLKNHQDT